MADLKKSFDEVKEAATGFASGNIMTSLQKDVSDALKIDDIDKPNLDVASDAQVASAIGEPVTPTTPAAPTPETFVEAEAHAAASEPLAITREVAARAAGRSRRPRPTCSRTPKRHERRRHRGQQSAVDGSSDRAALAADQGAAWRSASPSSSASSSPSRSTTCWCGRSSGSRALRIRSSSTPRCWNTSSPS